jgi:hypothetical protein
MRITHAYAVHHMRLLLHKRNKMKTADLARPIRIGGGGDESAAVSPSARRVFVFLLSIVVALAAPA